MAANLNPKSPLMLGGLALAAFWLVSRASAKKASAIQRANANATQSYNTPTTVAAALGAFVASYARGAKPTVRTDDVAPFSWENWSTNSAKAASDWANAQPALGTFTFGANATKPAGWETQASSVDVADNTGFGGEVYTLADDFRINAFGQ